jgi:hypothetical protein
MQITVIAFQYQTIHLASYQSYQSHLIQYHPNQSTIDEAGEILTKKQKVKYAASMHTFHGAAMLHLEDIYRKKSVQTPK